MLWIAAGAVSLALLALAAGIVLDEARLSGRERRLVGSARDAGRDLAAVLARELAPTGCERLAAVASQPTFTGRAERLRASSPEIAYLHVLNAQGNIVWSSEQGSLATGWRGGAPGEFLGAGARRSRVTDADDPEEADVFVEMVTAVGPAGHCGAVVLGLSELGLRRALRRETARTVAALAGFGLSILALAATVSWSLTRRRGEEIRRQAQAQHLAELGLLAAGLAHELRNPLNAMRFAVDSLAHRARKAGPAAVAEEMQEITREVSDEIAGLERIVSSFLSYARPAEDRAEEVELSGLARSALAVVQPELDRRGVVVRFEAPPRPPSATVLPGPLRQVLINLLQNAAQACEPGGTIVLKLSAEGGRVVLGVEDDGVGVPPELRASLFEPFATGRREGTGLGLAICRRLVQAMGGTISYLPLQPRGSRFTVELPRRAGG